MSLSDKILDVHIGLSSSLIRELDPTGDLLHIEDVKAAVQELKRHISMQLQVSKSLNKDIDIELLNLVVDAIFGKKLI